MVEVVFSRSQRNPEVKAELENRGHHIPVSLSGPMQKLCKRRCCAGRNRTVRRSRTRTGRLQCLRQTWRAPLGLRSPERLAIEAIVVTKKANGSKSSWNNFYGNKLATLRADATNAFRNLAPTSAGDSSAIAELLEAVFSPTADSRRELRHARSCCYNLHSPGAHGMQGG